MRGDQIGGTHAGDGARRQGAARPADDTRHHRARLGCRGGEPFERVSLEVDGAELHVGLRPSPMLRPDGDHAATAAAVLHDHATRIGSGHERLKPDTEAGLAAVADDERRGLQACDRPRARHAADERLEQAPGSPGDAQAGGEDVAIDGDEPHGTRRIRARQQLRVADEPRRGERPPHAKT